jgi:excinuclease ABC subunit C
VGERDEDVDLVGFSGDELQWAVAVFLVRRGRVVGRTAMLVDRVEDLTDAELVDSVLERLYDEPPMGVPRDVLVSQPAAEVDLLEQWLGAERGTKVAVRVPQRGAKRELMETVVGNAAAELARHRLRRASDHNARARALNELQDALGLPDAPLRIECFDMSHLQGSDYVGSMVVLEDGQPRRSQYRRFKVRTVDGNDDYAAMGEVLERRLRAYLDDRAKPIDERGKFSYPPQLLLVDGGKGQLAVAQRVVRDLGLADEIPVAALAKRFEEVFVPGDPDPVRVPRGSEALFLLQRVRDEAHRFAVSYHRELRTKRMTRSVLDGVPGLGDLRRKRLVKELGGVRAVQRASLDDLRALTWLPHTVADALYEHLHGAGSARGTAT